MTLPAVPMSQSPESKFREYLASRPKPQRYTEQQRDMVRFIFSQHSHFDAEQLIDQMKQSAMRVSRATIYRTLAKLVDAGMLRRMDIAGRTYYEHEYGYPQHEHLVCERCAKMIEFQSPEIEALLKRVAATHQFQMNGHNLIVRGSCQECNRARTSKRRLDLI